MLLALRQLKGLALAGLALFLSGNAAAADCGVAVVTSFRTPDLLSVALAGEGEAPDREIKLGGIMVPIGYQGYGRRVADLLVGREIRVPCEGDPMDRYDVWYGPLRETGGQIVQLELLRSGMALLADALPEGADAREWLQAEADAVSRQAGLWQGRSPFRWALGTDGLPDRRTGQPGRFRRVEGRVHAVANVRGTTMINFGPEYRQDVTLEISGRVARAMRKSGRDPQGLAGQTVRFRGRFDYKGGPRFILVDPVTLELTEGPGAAP